MNKQLDLNELIKMIDVKLSRKEIPIREREDYCRKNLSLKFNTPLPLVVKREDREKSLGHFISYAIGDWYSHMYGEKRRVNIDLGSVFLLLNGDIYTCRVPNYYGQVNFFFNTDLKDTGERSELNVLAMIRGLTPALAKSFTDVEFSHVYDSFHQGREALEIINHWNSYELPMIRAAISDLVMVESHLNSNSPHLLQAKWCYNQFIEKIIKGWLSKAGSTKKELFNLSHNLSSGGEEFNKHYKSQVDIEKLKCIQGNPSMRYDEGKVTKKDIIKIQGAVFDVVNAIGFCPVKIN